MKTRRAKPAAADRTLCHRCNAITTWSPTRRASGVRCDGCGQPFPCRRACGHLDCAEARRTTVLLEDGEGERFSLAEFLAANAEMEPEDLAAVRDLRVGELYAAGGGAWAEWTVRRVA